MSRDKEDLQQSDWPERPPPLLEAVQADITREQVDAVVNAAGEDMSREQVGGIDKAIRDAGGPNLIAASRAVGKLCVGEARATEGYDLPARYVIHVVGPRYRGGEFGEAADLALAHREAVRVAYELGCRSIAVPAISTGVFGYPVELAAPIAVGSVRQALEDFPLELVRFTLFDERALAAYQQALSGR
jgi:O-acetyl-ADP-ribose deacetylase (regulator of RNase III)